MNVQNVILQIFFSTVLIFSVQCQSNWMNHLTTCILRDQTINMISVKWTNDTKRQPNEVFQFFSDLQKHIPAILLDPDVVDGDRYVTLLEYSYIHISIVEIKENYNSNALQRKFISAVYLGWGGRVEKNLIIAYHSQNIPNKFIKTALIWLLDKYLDASIKVIEIYNNVKKITTLYNYESESTVLMHNYDYSKKSHSAIDIFKIRNIFDIRKNLHNQTLTMTLAPSANLNAQLNSDGCYDPETLAGPHGLILKNIAKTSNFRWRILRVYIDAPKNETINKSCSVWESLAPLVAYESDVMGNFKHFPHMMKLLEDIDNFLGVIHVRHSEPIMAVIPIFYKTWAMALSNNFLSLFVSTIVIVIILKITTRLMKLDSLLWNIETMLYAIFGMGIETGRATNATERMILTCVLLLSMIYSVGIVDQLLDIKMELNQPLEINTLQELEKYNLTLMTVDFNRRFLLKSQDPAIISLAKNAITTYSTASDEDCIENLVRKSYKNLTCIQYHSDAERVVRMSIIKHGEANVQILKEHISMQWLMIYVRATFVHTGRFEKVVQYLNEAGLIDKWYKTEVILKPDEKSHILESKVDARSEKNSAQELKNILAIAIIGFVVSFVILLGELIFSRIKLNNKPAALKNKKVFKFRQGNIRKSVSIICSFLKNTDKTFKVLRKRNTSKIAKKINALLSGNART